MNESDEIYSTYARGVISLDCKPAVVQMLISYAPITSRDTNTPPKAFIVSSDHIKEAFSDLDHSFMRQYFDTRFQMVAARHTASNLQQRITQEQWLIEQAGKHIGARAKSASAAEKAMFKKTVDELMQHAKTLQETHRNLDALPEQNAAVVPELDKLLEKHDQQWVAMLQQQNEELIRALAEFNINEQDRELLKSLKTTSQILDRFKELGITVPKELYYEMILNKTAAKAYLLIYNHTAQQQVAGEAVQSDSAAILRGAAKVKPLADQHRAASEALVQAQTADIETIAEPVSLAHAKALEAQLDTTMATVNNLLLDVNLSHDALAQEVLEVHPEAAHDADEEERIEPE